MIRFPTDRDGWRLDIISLLAVLGESAMLRHSLPMTTSWLCMLPRLVPAPQALLTNKRPDRPKPHRAHIAGIHSGVVYDELNYFAHLLCDIPLSKFAVREVKIRRAPDNRRDADVEGTPAARELAAAAKAPALGLLRRRFTTTDIWGPRFRDSVTIVTPQRLSPLVFLSVGSCLLTLGLLAWAAVIGDGVAVIAIVALSLTSSLTGMASFWRPRTIARQVLRDVPDGDLALRTRHGAFMIIRCDENVARELYTGTEECEYWIGEKMFNALAGAATFLLMVGVVMMGNCTWTMQAALGASYMLLNGCYQLAALLPETWFWDFSRYVVDEGVPHETKTYTSALWKAIQVSKSTGWVTVMQAAPVTEPWRKWLVEAGQNIENKSWNSGLRLVQLMKEEVQPKGQ